MTSTGAVPDLTAAQVQRELFEQSLRADLLAVGVEPDAMASRIMTNPHLAGWVEAERTAERSVERRRLADLFAQNRQALAGFAGDKDGLVELISHLLRLPSEVDR